MREGKLHLAADADCVLLRGRVDVGVGERADGLGNGGELVAGGGGLEDGDGGGAVGLAGVKEDRLGDDGEASAVAERGGGLKGRLEGGEMVVAKGAAAIVDVAGAAEPAAVAALDGAQLQLGFFAGADGMRLALHADPGAAQRRQIALFQFFVGEARAGGGGSGGLGLGRIRRLAGL